MYVSFQTSTSLSCAFSHRTSYRPGPFFSRFRLVLTDGFLKSQSIKITFEPFIASAMAALAAMVLFPSPGAALVTRNTFRLFFLASFSMRMRNTRIVSRNDGEIFVL